MGAAGLLGGVAVEAKVIADLEGFDLKIVDSQTTDLQTTDLQTTDLQTTDLQTAELADSGEAVEPQCPTETREKKRRAETAREREEEDRTASRLLRTSVCIVQEATVKVNSIGYAVDVGGKRRERIDAEATRPAILTVTVSTCDYDGITILERQRLVI